MGPRDPSQGVSRALEALDLLQLATRLLGGIETAYRDVGAGAGACSAALGTDGALGGACWDLQAALPQRGCC